MPALPSPAPAALADGDPEASARLDRRSAEALDDALAHVPAYRTWRAFDPGSGAPVDQRYRALPALTKRLMNLHGPAAFVAPGLSLEAALRDGAIELVATSGTTEERILNTWNQAWWDGSERASWALNAHARQVATGDHHEAILVCPLNVGVPSAEPLPMARRRLGRFLYLNELVDPLAWPERHYRRMLDELAEFRPAVLEANPSLLARLCRYARRAGIRPWQPALVTLTYEYPSLLHRRQIRSVFHAPMLSSYGSTEAGYVFVECERGRLHQNTASCRVDFLPFAAEHASPSLGQLLVTTFDDPWRALVRFDAGDLGRLADGPCPCGRADGLTLAEVEGRAVNLTRTPEGRLVTQAEVDRRLAAVAGLEEYQLVQADERSYAVRVVGDGEGVVRGAEEVLRDLYGQGARVSASAAAAIPPEPSGKYRLVKPALALDAAAFVAAPFRPAVPPELAAQE